MTPWKLPRTCALLLALLAGCGSGVNLDAARFQLRLGNLEKVEEILGDATGPEVAPIRDEIAALREQRRELEAWIAEFRLRRGDRDARELDAELRRKLDEETDFTSREWIETEISATADWVAERDQGGRHETALIAGLNWHPPEEEDEGDDEESGGDPMLALVMADLGTARDDGSWRRALTILDMAMDDAPVYADEFAKLRIRVETDAAEHAREVVATARVTESERGPEEARRQLAAERWRFADAGAGAEVHRRIAELDARLLAIAELERVQRREAIAQAPRRREDGDPRGTAPADRDDPIELAVDAARAAGEGRLDAARDAWLGAAAVAEGHEADRYRVRALDAEHRLALRSELAAAFAARPEAFTSLAVTALGPESLVVGGETIAWSDLTWTTLSALCDSIELADGSRLGLALAKLARGESDGPRGGYADLRRLLDDGELGADDTNGLVALYRGERVPHGGYLWRKRGWVSAVEVEREELAAEVAALTKRFASADGPKLEAAYDELRALADDHAYVSMELSSALVARWEGALRELGRGRTLHQLESLAERRSELDRRREAALAVIFDEVRYFYPFNPTIVGSDRYQEYRKVQDEVDELVGSVRELWTDERAIKPTKSFRDALSDIRFVLAHRDDVGSSLELPEELPEWIHGVDPAVETLGLATFAWTPSEAAALEQSRRIRARNERLWNGSEALATAEANQVRITNDYRVMLGRRALAWNPKIQEAADMHSEYMSNTGDFGHFESGDPKRRTPFDRLRLAGYARGASENCHAGSGSPEGAHYGWTHSSGHHRNLLQASHTEMASSLVTRYWTQNFGTDAEFMNDLD